MPSSEVVHAYLRRNGFTVHTFNDRTPDVTSTARALDCAPAHIAKTLLVMIGRIPVVVVTSGDTKINSALLKKATGLSGKVKFPADEDVPALTGFVPGGVSPFLLPAELLLLIDDSLQRSDVIYPAAGDDRSAVAMSHAELKNLTGGQCVNVCVQIEA